jgi:hypothetical protein
MVEPAVRIRDRDGRQRLGDGVVEGLSGPCLGSAQRRLELRSTRFDRRQIGRVRGQVLQPRTRLFNRLADARGFVRPQVIHDHDVPRANPATTSVTPVCM